MKRIWIKNQNQNESKLNWIKAAIYKAKKWPDECIEECCKDIKTCARLMTSCCWTGKTLQIVATGAAIICVICLVFMLSARKMCSGRVSQPVRPCWKIKGSVYLSNRAWLFQWMKYKKENTEELRKKPVKKWTDVMRPPGLPPANGEEHEGHQRHYVMKFDVECGKKCS